MCVCVCVCVCVFYTHSYNHRKTYFELNVSGFVVILEMQTIIKGLDMQMSV